MRGLSYAGAPATLVMVLTVPIATGAGTLPEAVSIRTGASSS